jgi:NhaP-type Na+/H+ or K+/H+ antiporter
VLSPWLTLGVLAALLLGWSLVSQWAQARGVTGPMVFLVAGVLMSGLADFDLDPAQARTLAELTLVVVLFHDASTVRLASLRRDPGIALRLLLVGFPLALLLAGASTYWLLPGIGLAGAVLLAAAITPTDAGLGAATILDPSVPVRLRRALNVESGLNDGLATPVVLAALAVLVGESEPTRALPAILNIGAIPVLLGVGIGVGVGLVGAFLLDGSYTRALSASSTRALAVLTLPVVALSLAELTDGNGFIAAFVTGITFGRASRCVEEEPSAQEGVEMLADLLGFVMWLAAGGLVVGVFLDGFRWQWLVLAVAALTVIRGAAVSVSLLGSGLRLPTVAFLSWFGPRGLASIVFGLLALEELGAGSEVVADVTGVVGLTVLLSVVLHGATAAPLARRYGAWADRAKAPIETEPAPEPMPSRGRGFSGRFPLRGSADDQQAS